ncbi:MAG: energy transducer TonB [Edaphobacter sp.]
MTSKRAIRLFVGAGTLLVLAGHAFAEDKTVLAERLHRAIVINSIDDPQLKPWHLKLSFQLFDDKGQATEKGEIEEWWASPSAYKTVYTSPSYTGTEIQMKEGLYRSKGIATAPVLLQLARHQVVDPMPSEKEIADSTLDMKHHDFGTAKMDCIMLMQPVRNLTSAPLGIFPTYCFDRDQDSLRISSDFGTQVTTRNRIGIFQGKKVVIDQKTILGSVDAITAHVESLETVSLSESDLILSADLRKVGNDPIPVGSGVVAGLKISGIPPIYPEEAKINHISGSVVLKARIGTDGRIHSLRVVSTPDANLAIASMVAVRQWRYKPYLLNDEPVEVETQITTNFFFSAH